ncbi:hypothetical protein ACHAWF_015104 [Thalassiosira exigua]
MVDEGVITPRQRATSFSLDNPDDTLLHSSPNDSIAVDDLKSPSFSTTGSCPLDYSAGSSFALPISPVSPEGEGEGDKETECYPQTEDTTAPLPDAEASMPSPDDDSVRFLEGMKLLIENGADINLQDMHGRTPLHLACGSTSCALVEFLCSNGSDVNIQDVHGRTPLHIAVKEACVKCMGLLLEHGAKADTINSVGESPLHIASNLGETTCMEVLSPGVGCDESHSSVESASPSLFDHGIEGSFYQSPREIDGCLSRSRFFRDPNSVNETSRIQNDSGYFTARGNAWTKSKYYVNDKIDEEESSSIDSSTLPDVDGSQTSQAVYSEYATNRCYAIIELILDAALYFLHSVMVWAWQPRIGGSKLGAESGSSCHQFVLPPQHVADAMAAERLKRSSQ